MKIYPTLFLLLIIPTMSMAQNTVTDTHFNSYDEMLSAFQEPSADFRPTPLWVWHDNLDKDMLLRDLKDFKEVGIGGGFIHPRYGLITEYLSDEWFDMVEFSVEHAEKLGLKMWIYDENSFPSGFAGGWVPELMPESANQPTGLTMERVSEIPDADIAVILQQDVNGAFRDVTASAKSGDTGDFIIFMNHYYEKSKWFGGRSYVDLLIPGVTEKFIDVTMRGYEKHVGDKFGDLVPGVFTDEPNISPRGKGAMRTTPALFEEFEKRWGYDLKPHMPSIFEEVGEWKRVRHNYYELLLELFIDRWSKPWYEYTESKNLAWTGHYWEHGWPSPVHGGDNMAMYAWHQIPAVDMLFNTADQNSTQFGNIRAVKELRSIANQFGRVRTLSETYGAAGWELTFEDMKRNGDWEYVLGVNFMNQHLTYMNLTGDRKHDFPQGISYQTPWWKDYRVLNDYFARLSVALSSGEQVNDILILEPTTTTWMYYSPTKSHAQLAKIGESFHNFLSELEDYQVEYDLGAENTIKDFGAVAGNQFVINQRSYSTVVLPPTFENFDKKTFELVQTFLDNGGTIYCFGERPVYIDGKMDTRVAQISAHKNWHATKDVKDLISKIDLSEFLLHDPESVGGDLYHMRRELEDGQIVFLTNFSLTENSKGTFSMDGASVKVMDAFTGEARFHPTQAFEDRVDMSFDLPPAGSELLFVSNNVVPPTPPQPRVQFTEMSTEPSSIERVEPNFLTLDYIDLKVGDEKYEDIYFYTGGLKIWEAHGYPDNPWVSSVQWKSEWVKADTFGVGTGFEAHYPFPVGQGVDLSSLRAVVENPTLWEVQINGTTIKPIPGEWAIDHTWGVFDISSNVVIGENVISIFMRPMSIYAEIEPVYVIGNFDLEPQEQGWKLVPQTALETGSWKKQGLPFYAYDIRYSKKVDGLNGPVKVKLNAWEGTVASIFVNGEKAGIIGWQPYELDISEFVSAEENRIDVYVTGSFKNLLGPHHNVTRRGIVTPWSFKYAPEQQPQGTDYDLLDYGLMEDFDIFVSE